MKRKYPKIIITDEGVPFLKHGQMWMYQNNIAHLDDEIENGAPIDIYTREQEYLGTGFLSKNSHITVRILSKDPAEKLDRTFFAQRLKAALDYRFTVEKDNLDNCRLVYGEADLLPGLIVDRYNDVLVTQISSYGLEIRKDMLYQLLIDLLKQNGITINGIYERNDIQARAKEGLEMSKGFWKKAKLPTKTMINENGLKLMVDFENGQKTGYFLDQKSNRYLLRQMAHGKTVLDCFSHTGGFALNAALGKAKWVTAVDVSQTALDQALENAKLNHLEDKMDFVQADVFDYLDTLQPNQYDIIVLDPPAFTKSRRTINNAYHGYKNINMKAMKVLRHGGYLVTCSCSRFMEKKKKKKMLREASQEAGVLLKQVSVTQQNHDHPILWNMEETSYLKFYIFQVI